MCDVDLKGKTILVTGAAGFIGSNLIKRLLEDIKDIVIIGIDNMNDYYDVELKKWRLSLMDKNAAFIFMKGNIADKEIVQSVFEQYRPQIINYKPSTPLREGLRKFAEWYKEYYM